jgi:DNA-binding MarR family transcriptional regulator
MNSIQIDDSDYALWLLFARTHYRIKESRAAELRPYNITPEQSGALFYIYNHDNDATQSQISRWMLRKPQTISANIEGMVKKGLIKKKRDALRKNIIHLSLTEKGKAAYDVAIRRESLHEILKVLNGEQRGFLQSILKDLLKAAAKKTRKIKEDSIDDE